MLLKRSTRGLTVLIGFLHLAPPACSSAGWRIRIKLRPGSGFEAARGGLPVDREAGIQFSDG